MRSVHLQARPHGRHASVAHGYVELEQFYQVTNRASIFQVNRFLRFAEYSTLVNVFTWPRLNNWFYKLNVHSTHVQLFWTIGKISERWTNHTYMAVKILIKVSFPYINWYTYTNKSIIDYNFESALIKRNPGETTSNLTKESNQWFNNYNGYPFGPGETNFSYYFFFAEMWPLSFTFFSFKKKRGNNR